ncbi:MAG: hypothetical protein HY817_04725 [Candidatus Abawacabacteria bacterium]|nr:hypothetical protein [Candidatus Abawacabacteria bacterium]
MITVESREASLRSSSVPPQPLIRDIRTSLATAIFIRTPQREGTVGHRIDALSEDGLRRCDEIARSLADRGEELVRGYRSNTERSRVALARVMAGIPHEEVILEILEPVSAKRSRPDFNNTVDIRIREIVTRLRTLLSEVRNKKDSRRLLDVYILHGFVIDELFRRLIEPSQLKVRESAADIVGTIVHPGSLGKLEIFRDAEGILRLEFHYKNRALIATLDTPRVSMH